MAWSPLAAQGGLPVLHTSNRKRQGMSKKSTSRRRLLTALAMDTDATTVVDIVKFRWYWDIR